MLRQLLLALAMIALLFPAFALSQPAEEEEEEIQTRPSPIDSRMKTSTAEGASQMKMQRPEGASQMNRQRPEGASQMNRQRPEGAPQMQKGSMQKQLPQGSH